MKRYCLALDLVDDQELIAEYEAYHVHGWPEVKHSIIESGILEMEIYRVSNRLFMVVETQDDFSFEKKAFMDASNPKVKEWEELMWKYQQTLPFAKPGEKWLLMENIFRLG